MFETMDQAKENLNLERNQRKPQIHASFYFDVGVLASSFTLPPFLRSFYVPFKLIINPPTPRAANSRIEKKKMTALPSPPPSRCRPLNGNHDVRVACVVNHSQIKGCCFVFYRLVSMQHIHSLSLHKILGDKRLASPRCKIQVNITLYSDECASKRKKSRLTHRSPIAPKNQRNGFIFVVALFG